MAFSNKKGKELVGTFIALVLIFFCCLFIWRACDGFEVASEYIGRNLSEGVRGGTINAISSSLPELCTTLLALLLVSGTTGDNENAFAIGIGTTAGSAIFNGMIIPAFCILTVVGTVVLGVKVTSVNVSTKVLLRDGLSLIFCELILILFINGTQLFWWHGVILMALYVAYFAYMILSMKTKKQVDEDDDEGEEEDDGEAEPGMIGKLFYWLSLGPVLDLESKFIRDDATREKIKNEEWNGWPLLLASTAVIGAACWLLVVGCEWLGSGPEHPFVLFGMTMPPGLNMPVIFVAVIFASMATSVPDTVISIRDARDGDYDDAVANALGSNIFDVCFALGFPLFLYTIIFQKPIEMSEQVATQSAELRFILLVLTVIGFFIYFVGKRTTGQNGMKCVEMKKGKALLLLLIYFIFASYIIALGFDAGWANGFSDWLRTNVVSNLPRIGS